MRKLPSLRALEAFDAAARRSSFTAAADELSVTPSSISHQVRALERELGVALFHRAHRRVYLTDVGQTFAREVGAALGAMEAATAAISRTTRADILSIHSVPSFATQWLMPRLARFSARSPGLDVRLNASVEAVDLAGGHADVDIRYGRVFADPGVRVVPFPPETIVPLCSPTLGLCHPADLVHVPLIHSEVNLLKWADWLRMHNVAGVDLSRGLRFDRTFMSISAAIDGLGVCLESRMLAERELQAGRLVIPFGEDGPRLRCHSLLYLNTRARHEKIATFANWLFGEIEVGPA